MGGVSGDSVGEMTGGDSVGEALVVLVVSFVDFAALGARVGKSGATGRAVGEGSGVACGRTGRG